MQPWEGGVLLNGSPPTPPDRFFHDLFQAYTEAWNREDIDTIEAFYHIPFFSYKNGVFEAYSDESTSRAADIEWLDVNRREGPAKWERLTSSITRQGRNSVLMTSRWAFRRPDGSEVWDFVDTFHLCRFDGAWRFVSSRRPR